MGEGVMLRALVAMGLTGNSNTLNWELTITSGAPKLKSTLGQQKRTQGEHAILPVWTRVVNALLELWRRFWRASTCEQPTIYLELRRAPREPTN